MTLEKPNNGGLDWRSCECAGSGSGSCSGGCSSASTSDAQNLKKKRAGHNS